MDTEKDKLNPQYREQQQSDNEDFLGTNHGNAMPDDETDPTKNLNPDFSNEQKDRETRNRENPSIH